MASKSATRKKQFASNKTDFLKSCRVCMDVDKNCAIENIFDEEHGSIVDQVLYCTGINLIQENQLPTKICSECIQNLSIAHKFKTTCVASDTAFQKALTVIKDEPVSDDDTFWDDEIYNDGYSKGDGIDDKEKMLKLMTLRRTNMTRLHNLVKDEVESINKVQIDSEIKREPKRLRSYKKNKKLDNKRRAKITKQKKAITAKLHLLCAPCNVKFESKEEAVEHRKKHHVQMYVCEVCGEQMANGSYLYYHHQSRHASPKWSCDECDYRTRYKHDLAKHKAIHAGIKDFQCEFCTSVFRTLSALNSHIKFVHQGIRRFPCPHCNSKFSTRTKLNRHVDSHNSVKRYECEVCQSCYTRRCYWKKHMEKIHGIIVPRQRPGRITKPVIGDFSSTSVNGKGVKISESVNSKLNSKNVVNFKCDGD